MRTIEITTTQNVTIEYELAAVRDRILAFVIDFFVIWTGIGILSFVYVSVMPDEMRSFAQYVVVWPVFLFYALLSEIFADGRSLGKKALGIKVVKITGSEAGINDYFIRWAFRMVDIYLSIGALGLLLISSTAKAQRLGDIVANTAVIKIKPTSFLRLKNIMNISSSQNYTLHYPEVRQMKESEMLIVKTVLDRVKAYPNEAHKEVMDELVRALCERLNITEEVKEPQLFLRNLINDYIVLTR